MKFNFFIITKRGEILIEDIVFLILNLAFLSILVLFIVKQGSGTIVLEELYAKQISLLIDSAHEGSRLILDVSAGIDIAGKNGISREEIISIKNNVVEVSLGEGKGYKYSFFNDVQLTSNFDKNNNYVLVINKGVNNEKI